MRAHQSQARETPPWLVVGDEAVGGVVCPGGGVTDVGGVVTAVGGAGAAVTTTLMSGPNTQSDALPVSFQNP